jgi:hypothetical protein
MGSRPKAPSIALPPLLAVLPSVALLVLSADRLPEPLAVHFALDGSADGFLPRGAALALDVALGLFLAALFAGAGRTGPGPAGTERVLVAASWAVGGLLGPLLLVAAAVNLDLPDAAAAVLPVWVLPLSLAVGALTGLAGYRAAPRPAAPVPGPPPAPPLALGATERVSWSRRVSAPWAGPVALLLGAAGGGTALLDGPVPVALVAVLLAGTVLVLGSARVTVDRRGLTVGLGLLGRPRLHVPAEDVVSATTADVAPVQFGGWGYRVVPGGRGIIVRGGPALVVTQRSGRRLTVTVDDPGTAAGLLAGIIRC